MVLMGKWTNRQKIEGLLEMGATLISADLVRWLLCRWLDAQDEIHARDLRIAELEREVYNKLATDGR